MQNHHPSSQVTQTNHLNTSQHTQNTFPPQAGTSSTPHRINPKAHYFPVIDQGHLPAAPISGSSDLLSLFNVSSMYDWFVKPYLKPSDQPNTKLINNTLPTNNLSNHLHSLNTNGDLKGKGKADNELAALSPAQLENLGQKRMKMDKSYGHFVADVGGRNSIKKDHQLETWITDASFQEANIENFLKPFSSEVLAKSFTLQPGLLPGVDPSIWVAEEGGPKKRRKKRKQGEMLAGNNPPHPTAHPQHQLSLNQFPASSATTTQYPPLSSTHPQSTRPTRAVVDSSNHHHHHLSAQAAHLHLPQQQQQHPSPSLFCREDDYRKKKRVKIGNPSAGKNSGSGSSGPNHQVALQS